MNLDVVENWVTGQLRGFGLNFGEGDRYVDVRRLAGGLSVYFFDVRVFLVTEAKKPTPGVFFSVDKFVATAKEFENLTLDPAKDNKHFLFFPLDDVLGVSGSSCPPLITGLYKYSLRKSPGERFDCCSRYAECSDARACVHPDIGFTKNCIYHYSLDAGRVFYGVNRNID